MKPTGIVTLLSRILLILALVVAAAPLVQPIHAQDSQERTRLLTSAMRALDAGDLDAAMRNLEVLMQTNSDDPNVRYMYEETKKKIAERDGTGMQPAMAPMAPMAPMTPAAPGGNQQNASRLMAAAVQAENAGDLQTAQSLLQRLLAENPNDAMAQRKLAEINARLGGGAPAMAPVGQTSINRQPSAAPVSYAAAPAAQPSGNRSTGSSGGDLMQSQEQRQAQAINQAYDDLRAARKQAQDGYYEEALEFLNGVQRNIPDNMATRSVVHDIHAERIRIALGIVESTRKLAYLKTAEDLYADYVMKFGGDHTEAVTLRRALQSVRDNPYYRTAQQVSPEFAARKKQIDELLVKGRSQMIFGDYQGAITTLGQVEALEPDNVEAKALQTRIAGILNQEGEWNREKTRTMMLEEVNRSWARPRVFEAPRALGPDMAMDPVTIKLSRIRIPSVAFSDMRLSQVVETLNVLVQQNDTTTDDPANKGVNMVVIDPARVDPPVSMALRNSSVDKILDFVTRSVNFQYSVKNGVVEISPGQDGLNLETRFYPLPRSVAIRIGGFRDTGGAAADTGGGIWATPAGGGGGGGGGNAAQEEEEKIKAFLERAGVNFSQTPGSSFAYDQTQIIVTQTPRNFDRLETILRRYNETKQVEIEAKFLEVRQGLLEEMGFDWMLTNNNGVNLFSTGPTSLVTSGAGAPAITRFTPDIERFFTTTMAVPGIPPQTFTNVQLPGDVYDITTGGRTADGPFRQLVGNQLLTPPANESRRELSGGDGTMRTLRSAFLTNSSSSGQGEVIIAGNRLGIDNIPPQMPGAANLGSDSTLLNARYGIGGLLNVQTIIRALEQQTGSDLMSAPKVAVLSGKTASIRVAQELRYPESYGDAEAQVSGGVDGGSGSVAITPGTPQDFTTRNVGVELEVTPTVEDDNSISLRLEPKVTEFEGFVEYGGKTIAVQQNATVILPSGFYQPIFSVREVRTEVTVYDGATVLMGGLTREEVKTVNDKVPVLGDIPLFGRLFRSEGKTQQKRNLLIFVTANLVSPGGSPSRQQLRDLQPGSLFQNPVLVTPSGPVPRTISGQ